LENENDGIPNEEKLKERRRGGGEKETCSS
jgi:hypothetical protein